MLALALVLEGHSREDSAQICGMDRQTLRDWVHRYNAEGIAGLSNRPAPGPEPRLSADQEAAVAEWIESGPDLERDGVVRWRCRDLKERIEREFQVSFHERTIGKLLARLGFRRLSVRPQHPESDVAEQEAFKGALLTGLRMRSAPSAPGRRLRSGSATKHALVSRAPSRGSGRSADHAHLLHEIGATLRRTFSARSARTVAPAPLS
jgi:transposase